MSRMNTKSAEEIYSILERYAEASSKYYDREGFIYSFSVVPNTPSSFILNCMDGKRRVFTRDGDNYALKGSGEYKINPIISAILSKNKKLNE